MRRQEELLYTLRKLKMELDIARIANQLARLEKTFGSSLI